MFGLLKAAGLVMKGISTTGILVAGTGAALGAGALMLNTRPGVPHVKSFRIEDMIADIIKRQREIDQEWGQSRSKSSKRLSAKSRIDPESSSYDNNDYDNGGHADGDDQGDDEDADSNEDSDDSTDDSTDDSSDSESDEGEKRRKRRKRSRRIRSIHKHIVARLRRWFRYGGFLQRISKDTKIPVHDIVRRGASQYQDRRSGRGRTAPSGHLVRDGEINPDLERDHPQCYRTLRNFLGHTQIVPFAANCWGGLGGVMDLFQEQFMEILLEIDFNGDFTPVVGVRIIILRDAFINVLRNRMEDEITDMVREEIEMAIDILLSVDAETLFKLGKRGYEGEIMKPYRQ